MMMPQIPQLQQIKLEPGVNQPPAATNNGRSKRVAGQPIKMRRTRQPRNPQLSVARRNERERNRVKMVNNGFALLREHLPIEDLQAHSYDDQSDDDTTPTPDCGAAKGSAAKAAGKKFSKVETLRAAIARIRMLEELIRSTEPGFESMNIQQPHHQMDSNGLNGSTGSQLSSVVSNQGAYDMDEPLSVCEPLSCHSASSASPIASQQVFASASFQNQTQPQFLKVEPAGSPDAQCATGQIPSHTHIWLQQHQNSFIEQQQQYEQPPVQHQSGHWYGAATTTTTTTSTTTSTSPAEWVSQLQMEAEANCQQQVGPETPDASPIWFNTQFNQTGHHLQDQHHHQHHLLLQQQQQQQQQAHHLELNHHHLQAQHQQQQISLYSQ